MIKVNSSLSAKLILSHGAGTRQIPPQMSPNEPGSALISEKEGDLPLLGIEVGT